MASDQANVRCSVDGLWRYPVKSFNGEAIEASAIGDRGLLGDRAYALFDVETGKVVSAKHPRKWGNLFEFRAAYVESPSDTGALPPARITLPGGDEVLTDQVDIDRRLSERLGRPVRLSASAPESSVLEGYWPDLDFLPRRDEVFDVTMPPGTFFDLAPVHLVTSATLERLSTLAPGSRFDARRFRPNLVIDVAGGPGGFEENDWVGRTLALGDDVLLRVTRRCPRCVMTTLPQGDLPKDPQVLRAAVQNNEGDVGVCANVVRGGHVRRGDPARLV